MDENTTIVNRRGLLPNDFLGWILLFFVIGSLTLTGHGQLRSIGVLMAGCYTLYFLRNKLWIPNEMIIYFAWVVWSGTTGYLVSIDKGLFLGTYKVVFQNLLMSFAVLGITYKRKTLDTNFTGIIIGGTILFFTGITSGEFFGAVSGELDEGVTGLTANPNEYGYNLLLCSVAPLYFWKNSSSLIKRLIIISLLTIFLSGIISSASRKAFLGFVLLITLWLWVCYSKQLLKRLSLIFPIILAVGALYFVTDYMLSNTYMGKRFKGTHIDATKNMSLEEREEKRISFYKQGIKLIIQNPVFGIGLGNFKVFSVFGKESHSEFIEVITSTGIIGAFLYFFIFFLLWHRIKKIQIRTEDPLILYKIRLFKVIVIVILVVGFGRLNFTSQLIWVVLSGIIGYTWSLDNNSPYLKTTQRLQAVKKL